MPNKKKPSDPQVARLEDLLAKGELYVITDEHACCGGVTGYVRGVFQDEKGNDRLYFGPPPEACAAYEHKPTSPLHFVCHQADRLEGPDARDRYKVHATEGDCWTMGYAEDLVKKLTEYRRAVLSAELS